MAILAASSNIAWVARRESVGSDFCTPDRLGLLGSFAW